MPTDHPPATLRPRPPRRRRRLIDEVRDLIVEDFIATGVVKAGERLPSEKDLSERYGVSRVTLRACIRSLEEAGLITSRHGIGSIVLHGTTRLLLQGFERLGSVDSFAEERGQSVTTLDTEFERLRADDRLAAELDIASQDQVLAVRRVKAVSGERAAWLIDYVPERTLSFDVLQREFAGSTLDVLLAHREVGVGYADTEIQAVNLPAEIARRLEVPPGTAALYTRALARTMGGQIVELAEGWLLSRHFGFTIRRRPS